MEATARDPSARQRWDLAALLLAIVAAAVRCATWRHVFSAEGVIPLGVDPYYHLRRASLLAETFPASPQLDPYLSFPTGAPIPWPPGFDLLVALPALFNGEVAALATWGSLLMPALGGLAVFLTYRLGVRIFEPSVALLAAALLALMPGAVQFSLLGRIDHHGLVAPVTLGTFLAFLAATRATSRAKVAAAGALCGALAAAAVGSWIVTPPLYFLPIPATVVGLAALRAGDSVRAAAPACLGAAALLVLAVVMLSGDLATRPFSLYQPSLFAVTLYAVALLVGVAATTRPRSLLPVAGLVAVVVAGVTGASSSLRDPLVEALTVVSGRDTSYLTAWESFPLLFHGDFFNPRRAASQYGGLVFALPALAALYCWRIQRAGDRRPGSVLFAFFAICSVGLLFFQQRFGEYAAPAVALLFAWSLVEGGRSVSRFARRRGVGQRIPVWTAPVAVGLAIVAPPLGDGLHTLFTTDPVHHQRGLVAFARELARSTPDPGSNAEPRYGLLTSWMDAHPLLFASERPVAVSSFATAEARSGNRRAFRMLLTRDESGAALAMRQARLRYLVVSPILESVEAMAAIAGIDEPFVQPEEGTDDAGRAFVQYRPLLPFAESLHTRLLLADGSEIPIRGFRSPPAAHFRLHVESSVPVELFGGRVPRYKAFEVVSGARITGSAAPGERVELRLTVESNIGRRFEYVRASVADAAGRFEIVVPYATEGGAGPTRSVGRYRVRVGDRVRELRVTEREIQEGGEISLASASADFTPLQDAPPHATRPAS